jgi:predicted MFS family arabinose efflux permease
MDGRAHPTRLVVSGIAMVGMSFGLARYGYGLLLPEIRHSFHLSSAALGAIATGSYVAYLVGTAAMALLGGRLGPRAPIALAGAMAVIGMGILATASSPAMLALGVLIAGACAAFAYPPFSEAVAADIPRPRQSRALSIISSGTGWGVAAAVPIALVVGSQWRAAWLVFAVVAVLATALALVTVRDGRQAADGSQPALPPLSWSWFVCPRSGPLLVGALLVGIGASVFWTFGADFAAGDGPSRAAGPVLLGLVGVSSVLGSVAGDLLERIGGRPALRASAFGLAASLCVLALWHGSWLGVVVAGVAFGATYNILLAVQAIWSTRVFAQRPATGLAAMLFMLGIGQLVGPPLAGALADSVGLAPAFYLGGALVAGVALLPPREELRAETRQAHQGEPSASRS